jgi:protein-tyrosine-phosphatase
MKILFVCRGNVGRSQIAEALLKKELKDVEVVEVSNNPLVDIEVMSAGTLLSEPEQAIGELTPAIDNVVDVMKEVGVDVSKNFRTQITEEMANDADRIILVVDERDPIPEYLVNNPKVEKWDVLDPKGQSLEFTRQVRDQIGVFVKGLVVGLQN